RNAADSGNIFIHPIFTEILCRIDVIDQNTRLVVFEAAVDPGGFDGPRDPVGVACVYSFLQDMPGDGTINFARIHIGEAEASRKLARNAAFPGRGGAINGNHPTNRAHLSNPIRATYASCAGVGVSEPITGVLSCIRFGLENSSSTLSNPG